MSATPTYDPATQPKRPEASLGELLSEMTTDLSTLLRKEVELAKTEAREEIGQAGKAGAMLGAAGLAGWLALLMLSLAVAWLLDQSLNTALSFAIVGIVWAIAAAILLMTGASADQHADIAANQRNHQGERRMGQNADELRQDIEQTRDGLSDTLDAIGDRVSPGRMIERRKNRAVQGIQSLRDRVMGSASDATDSVSDATGSAVDTIKDAPDAVRHQTQGSPVAAGAIAFGVGFLIAAIFPPSQPEQQVARRPHRQGRATEGRAHFGRSRRRRAPQGRRPGRRRRGQEHGRRQQTSRRRHRPRRRRRHDGDNP